MSQPYDLNVIVIKKVGDTHHQLLLHQGKWYRVVMPQDFEGGSRHAAGLFSIRHRCGVRGTAASRRVHPVARTAPAGTPAVSCRVCGLTPPADLEWLHSAQPGRRISDCANEPE